MSDNRGNKWRLPRKILCLFIAAALIIFTAVPVLAQEGAMLEITASVTGTNAAMINTILEDSSLTIKTDVSGEDFLLNLDTVVAGQSALRVLLEAAEGKVAFSLPDIENVRYEYDLQTLLPLLEEAFGAALQGNGQDLSQAFSGAMTDITADEVMAALSPYIEYLGGAVSSVMKSENGVFELEQLGKTLEGTIVSYEPGPEDLARVLGGLADMMEGDETLKGLVDKICASVEKPEGLGGLLQSSLAASGEEVDLNEIASGLREGYSQLPTILREAAGDLSEEGMGDGYIRFVTGTANDLPCKYQLKAGSPGAGEFFEAGVEIDWEQSGAGFYAGTQDQDFAVTVNTVDTGDFSTTCVVTAKVNKVPVFILTFTVDPANGFSEEFPLSAASVDIAGVNISLAAQTGEGSGRTMVFNVSGLEVPGDSTGISGITVKAHTDTASDLEKPAGEVMDLTGYDPETLTGIFGMLGEKIERHLSDRLPF